LLLKECVSILSAIVAMASFIVPALGEAPQSDRLKLWDIVHNQCLPGQLSQNPAPCVEVDVVGGVDNGFAVLPDRNGVAQFLLIPTRRVTGIESPLNLEQGTPDYWNAAWQARKYVIGKLHRALSRDAIGLAVNSYISRSQDQLHIHIECLAPEVSEQLRRHAPEIGPTWAKLEFDLAGQRYMAMRVESSDLRSVNPFMTLSTGLHVEGRDMERETLVVVGASFGDGKDGFIFLEDHADPATGDTGHGEDLLDNSCAIATAAP